MEYLTVLICSFLVFAAYNQTNLGGNMINCDVNRRPGEGQVCIVDVEQFGPCGPSASYGYNSSQPCVYLKLNRVSRILYLGTLMLPNLLVKTTPLKPENPSN